MKHLSILFCFSALAGNLTAQHLPETTHCRLDSALMACTNWGRTDYQKIVFTYGAQDQLLEELMTYMEEDSEGNPLPWLPRRRTTYTPGAQGLPELSIQESIDWETGDWVEDVQTRFEYDAHGNCVKEEEFSYSWTEEGISSERQLTGMQTYTYDDQDRLIEQEGAYYSDGVPNYQFKYVLEYGPYGITSESNWGMQGGQWVKGFELIFDYSNTGLLVCETGAEVDEDGQLQYTSRREYEYDEQDHLKLMRYYYRQYNDAHPKLEFTNYYTCNAKGVVVKEEQLWADEKDFSNRIEYTYDEHDDLVNMKQFQRTYDPDTWETLPDLVLHEEETYYYKCLGGSSLQQLHAQPMQRGCMMMGGKIVIVCGDKCYDLMGHAVE